MSLFFDQEFVNDTTPHRQGAEAPRSPWLRLNDTRRSYPQISLQAMFARRVQERPDAVALLWNEEMVTYLDLYRRALPLSSRLREGGVGPGNPVGLFLERSLGGVEMVVALLAILFADGAYVPLDPHAPPAQLELILREAIPSAILTLSSLASQLPYAPGVRVHCVDVLQQEMGHHEDPPLRSAPDTPCCFLPTSGSTGRPKLVVVPHRAVMRLLFGGDWLPFGPEQVFLQAAPIFFDAASLELWGALLHGARCVLLPVRTPTAVELRSVTRKYGISVLWLTASLFNLIVDEDPTSFATVPYVLTGGETLSVAHVRRAQDACPNVTFINGYGPTECGTFTCCYRIPRPLPADLTAIPIGTPIANTYVYVFDQQMHLTPVETAGRLYIGGPGVGCYHAPELTAQSFLANPLQHDTVSGLYTQEAPILYDSGDVVQLGADGLLHFIAREGDFFKLRGHRVTYGEVETTLCLHPSIAQAVVRVKQDEDGNNHLVAYVVSKGGEISPAELVDFLKDHLEGYKVPTVFLTLPVLPLSPTHKIDFHALPEPDWPHLAHSTEERPALERTRTEEERVTAEIVSSVMNQTELLDPHLRLSLIGGDSETLIRIVARLRAHFGLGERSLTVDHLEDVDAETVAQIAAVVAAKRAAAPPDA